jgi:hypothetical protein
MFLPDNVAVPITLFPAPDLSFHCVTVVVEFMVDPSAASSHTEQAGMSNGVNVRLNGGMLEYR